jgi:hypothetical protein
VTVIVAVPTCLLVAHAFAVLFEKPFLRHRPVSGDDDLGRRCAALFERMLGDGNPRLAES